MFKHQLYEVVRNVISSDLCAFIDHGLELNKKLTYLNNQIDESSIEYFDDYQCPNAFPSYNLITNTLCLYLQQKIETVVEKSLFPTYSYSRIYYTGSTMREHVDRPSCEISASLCVSSDPTPWELWFKNDYGENSVILYPGDMIIYNGCLAPHWRNEYKGNRQSQIFLHYVDQQGKYADFKYDCREFIGMEYTSDVYSTLERLNDFHLQELKRYHLEKSKIHLDKI